MQSKRLGAQTVKLTDPPRILAGASVVGKKEGEGPLRSLFDEICNDSYFGMKSWEQAESAMFSRCFAACCSKADLAPSSVHYLFSGDLQNQCTASTFGLRSQPVPYFGLYGACSTMAEAISLAAMVIDGGFADTAAAMTGSHFCTAERQYRLPLEYGGQRTPTAQWTVTGAGAVILGKSGPGPAVTHITTGIIRDAGIKDAANMGAAMAPAACETLEAHFRDTGRRPSDYDAVITGDLGHVGHEILLDLLKKDGFDVGKNFTDCGILIFDAQRQDVHAGGSGCGCSASVLCSYVLNQMEKGIWKRVLFAATGALLSPTTTLQGESIPGIAHALVLEGGK